MSDPLHVELVAADRVVWSGDANIVVARTAEGEVGILADHAPLMSLMVPGVVEVRTDAGETVRAAVDSGFLSVGGNRVSILAEEAVLASDIDAAKATKDLAEAERGDLDDEAALGELRRARAWVLATERS
ncbi:MAG: F0F1 ATP synthase subunit epsilon [Actinomycetota bacterium]|nr:F0F1 ATP synthase subunit epsilon [Actinomycetota bacterium]